MADVRPCSLTCSDRLANAFWLMLRARRTRPTRVRSVATFARGSRRLERANLTESNLIQPIKAHRAKFFQAPQFPRMLRKDVTPCLSWKSMGYKNIGTLVKDMTRRGSFRWFPRGR